MWCSHPKMTNLIDTIDTDNALDQSKGMIFIAKSTPWLERRQKQ